MWEKGLKNKEVDLLDVLLMLKDDNGRSMLTVEEIKALIVVSTLFPHPSTPNLTC